MNRSEKPYEFREESSFSDEDDLPLKYSISQISTRNASFEEDVVAFIENGIPAIGLWRSKLEEYGVDRGIDRLFAAELPVSSISFVGDFTSSNAAGFRDAYDDAFEMLFTARAVRAETVIVAPGSRGRYTERHERRLVRDVIRELGCAAEEFGIRLAVLPMCPELARRWTILQSLQQAVDLIDEIDHPSVGVVFDTFLDGRDPDVLERLPEFVNRIGIVQVSDAPKVVKSAYDRLLPGLGEVPLAEIGQTLQEYAYEGYFDVQIWSRSLWTRSVHQILNECRSTFHSVAATKGKRTAESVVS